MQQAVVSSLTSPRYLEYCNIIVIWCGVLRQVMMVFRFQHSTAACSPLLSYRAGSTYWEHHHRHSQNNQFILHTHTQYIAYTLTGSQWGAGYVSFYCSVFQQRMNEQFTWLIKVTFRELTWEADPLYWLSQSDIRHRMFRLSGRDMASGIRSFVYNNSAPSTPSWLAWFSCYLEIIWKLVDIIDIRIIKNNLFTQSPKHHYIFIFTFFRFRHSDNSSENCFWFLLSLI